MSRYILCCLAALMLAGCVSSQRLGISQQAWQAMSPQKRDIVLANYKKIRKLDRNKNRTAKVYDGPKLSVYMLNGKAMMPPFTKRYTIETDEFKIVPGECKYILLKSIDTNHRVHLHVCYNGERLSLDPSRYDPDKSDGTVHFNYNPIWKRGFTYSNVNSSGYVRLQDASVSIKAIPRLLPIRK